MELNDIDRIVDELINKAFENGGTLWFMDAGLSRMDEKSLKRVNVTLSQYGEIYGIESNSQWSSFKLNEYGIDIVRKGGVDKELERAEFENRLKELEVEVAELQKEKMEYERKLRRKESVIRYHKIAEAVSWTITLILAVIHFLFE